MEVLGGAQQRPSARADVHVPVVRDAGAEMQIGDRRVRVSEPGRGIGRDFVPPSRLTPREDCARLVTGVAGVLEDLVGLRVGAGGREVVRELDRPP
jgi:hypothetical protein